MNYRWNEFLPAKSLSADNVETLDITTRDPISAIQIQYKGTNGDDVPDGHPAKLVSKVEVVDGSEVICSLSGIELNALMYYHFKVPPLNIMSYYNNQVVTAPLTIPFGRWLWDKELALDPTRFKNLQLKITTDLDGGGSSCDAGTLEVNLCLFDQKTINPIGFLMAKEWYSYTVVASAYETIEMPADHPIKMFMVQSLVATKQPWEVYNEIKLSEDGDKRVPLDNKTSDLLKYLCGLYPPIVESIEGKGSTTAVRHYITPTYEVDAGISGLNNNTNYFSEYGKYGGILDVVSDTANKYFGAVVKGYAPHGAIGIETGMPNEITDWYDVEKLNSLRLRLKGGSSPGTGSSCKVVTQQLVKY